MRQARLTGVTLALVVGVALLSGCVPEGVPSADPSTSTSTTPTLEPTPVVRVIAGGERPPGILGGDCERLVSADLLTEVLGGEIASVHADESTWTDALRNVGGVRCVWETSGDGGFVDVIDLSALEPFGIEPEPGAYDSADDCDWHCTWTWQDDRVWMGAISWDGPSDSQTRAEWSRVLGPKISQAVAAGGDPSWTRDTDEWWPGFDCEGLASAIGERGGLQAIGIAGGYDDLPPAGTLVADDATNPTRCWIEVSDGLSAELRSEPGLSWAGPQIPEMAPVDLGVDGIDAWVLSGADGAASSFVLVDGVNRMTVQIIRDETSGSAAQQLAVATAQLMASGIRGVPAAES